MIHAIWRWISLHQPLVSSHLLNHLSAHESLGGKLAGLWHLTLMILSILKIFYKLSKSG
ncbi:hypothetical protein QN277_006088 [Acacia crassicarpa]|uniref:Uncharacterized protein n=1 Tax=Acacia crassicarpa TaxID=499986 RepID=A0AAE1MC80_9FABA|nr:hypothetical protein QN277_006088 [Acacia crassicarpa]